jgi:hypothetical protein
VVNPWCIGADHRCPGTAAQAGLRQQRKSSREGSCNDQQPSDLRTPRNPLSHVAGCRRRSPALLSSTPAAVPGLPRCRVPGWPAAARAGATRKAFTPARAEGRRSSSTMPSQGPGQDKSDSRLSTRGAAVPVWSRPPSEPRKVSHYEVIWVREAVTVCVPAAVASRPLRQGRSEAEDGPRRDRAPAPTGQRRGPADSVPVAAPAPGRLAGRLGPVSPGNRANGSAALKTETPGHAFWPGVSSFAQLMLSAVSSITKDVSL